MLSILYGSSAVKVKQVAVEEEPATDLTWPAYVREQTPVVQESDVSELLIVHTTDIIPYVALDKFCLAKNIYHEARSEDLLGRMAVAQVTLNRVESPNYPDTVCGVVMQKFQFSWANNRNLRWTHPKGRAWEKAKDLAEDFLANGVRVQGLQTALFYHADYVNPRWRDNDFFVAQIGTHLFYEKAKPL